MKYTFNYKDKQYRYDTDNGDFIINPLNRETINCYCATTHKHNTFNKAFITNANFQLKKER